MSGIDRYLQDLESRIDSDVEEDLLNQWKKFADGKADGRPYFTPTHRTPKPPTIKWPSININDALADEELMLIREFAACSHALESGSDLLMQVRANYGVGIIPLFFGAELFVMPRECDTLPNVRPVSEATIRRIAEGKLPSLDEGVGPRIFAFADSIERIRKMYPKIARYVRIDHPDSQGPMDICELLWGSDYFYALYDEPDFVKALLESITDFYIRFLDEWFDKVPAVDDYCTNGCRLNRGLVCVRNDSAMNLSPEIFDEFIYPYDERILSKYGGSVHFCGRGEHFIERLSEHTRLYRIDVSQPHLNDMKKILACTVERGICLTVTKSELPYCEHGNLIYQK